MADFAVCFARNFTSCVLMTGVRVSVWMGSLEAKATCRDRTGQQRSCHSVITVEYCLLWVSAFWSWKDTSLVNKGFFIYNRTSWRSMLMMTKILPFRVSLWSAGPRRPQR